GDRSLANAIERAYRDGARFDSWEECLDLARWQRCFDEEGISLAKYTGTIPLSARLPWSHIDVGLEDGFLAKEYRKALKDQLSLPCGKAAGMFVHHTNVAETVADARKLVCYDCGVACDLTAMRGERLVYLKKLGADGPITLDPARLASRVPKGPEARRPKVSFTQGEARRYRLRFTKLGAASFLSHLDLLRAIPRMFRRLGVPLFYSQGFHPKPDLTFGPALSLGVASLHEYVDVKIAADVDEAELAPALTAHAPQGIVVDGVTRLRDGDTNVAKLLGEGAHARYVVAVAKSALSEMGLGDASALKREIEGQLEGGSLTVIRYENGREGGLGKKIDVRHYLEHVDIDTPAARALLDHAGIVGDVVPIEVVVRLAASGGVKISEVVEALLGKQALFQSVRAGLWAARAGRRIDPIDVHLLRDPSFAATNPTSGAVISSAPAG
ncbi:MAG: TIGR03936 family radical SAM-associated protein, partial [Polyangiales bacterium]